MDISPVTDGQGPEAPSTHRRIGSLQQAADFQRLLAVRPRAKTTHFVVHHLPSLPTIRVWTPKVATSTSPVDKTVKPNLSTDVLQAVDEFVESPSRADPSLPGFRQENGQLWLGMVIPKKQARRAVTRNLVRRQMRAAADRHLSLSVDRTLTGGLWLLRLKQGFSTREFPSADSLPLRRQVREELDQLFAKALQATRGVPPRV